MKKYFSLLGLSLLLALTGRADDLPFFSALRVEIFSQATTASNTVPLDRRLIAALNTNLKLIDRTKPTLVNGSAALGTLAKNLGRTSLSNTFLPLLSEARTAYADRMDAATLAFESRLTETLPGKLRAAAENALSQLRTTIGDARTNASLTLALKSLSKAAKAVGAVEKAVARAESAPPGAGLRPLQNPIKGLRLSCPVGTKLLRLHRTIHFPKNSTSPFLMERAWATAGCRPGAFLSKPRCRAQAPTL
jgi:hypothetical protein